jgi:hypothetical protein
MLVYIMLTMCLRPFAASVDNWLQLASLTGGWVGGWNGVLSATACLAGSTARPQPCFCSYLLPALLTS